MKGQPTPHATGVAAAPAPPKRSAYPKGSTDNRLIMEAAHRLAPGPFKLYSVLLVRMAGKGVCYLRTDPTLMADLGEPERNVRRWRRDLIDQGFITTTRKGRARGCLTYRLVTGPLAQPVRPTGGSVRPFLAGQTGQKWPVSLEEPNEGASRPPCPASEPEEPDSPPTSTAKQCGAAQLRKTDELEAGLNRALVEFRYHQDGLDAATEAVEAHKRELTLRYMEPSYANPPPDDSA